MPANATGGPKWRRSFPYKVDYNDHFETPLIAYQDILPLLEWLMLLSTSCRKDGKKTGKSQVDQQQQQQRANFCIYDPYYCNGKAADLLREIGFENVIHAPRDFYGDIEQNQIPNYDALVTNPPYSDQHKMDCLSFCFQQLRAESKPFFILMPNYVAARNYYREQLYANNNNKSNGDQGVIAEDVCYIIPNQAYEYEHPDGTGHDIPPFASLWYCGIGKDRVRQVRDEWMERHKEIDKKSPRLAVSVEELQQWNAIPTMKRPNPRQRRKRQQQQQRQLIGKEQDTPSKEETVVSAKTSTKTSKYRNREGRRGKKRF